LADIDARRHRIRVDVELGENLPRIWADPILISQVLLNLMKNAIEAMNSPTADVQPGAERSLRVTARALDHHLEFAVADTGPGLSSALKERLFEPFYTTKSEGMGMGLNICRTIVEFHEGRLWVEPAKPRGCIFRFTLPYAQSYEATEDS
jgi:signal transduction histidine kinase